MDSDGAPTRRGPPTRLPPSRLNAGAWVIIGILGLVGCAQRDWIDRTLVTVDVTGVWEGTQRGTNYANNIELDLKQEGPRVTGQIRGIRNTGGTLEKPFPIVGTVSGDTLSLREASGQTMRLEVQVNGDEMTGSGGRLTTRSG